MTPTVVALHGFTRGPQHLERLAQAVNAAGLSCVRPALAPRWLPVLYMSRTHLAGIARRLVDRGVTSAVIVGHSAGAAAGCYLAVGLRQEGVDVRGVVLVDGVDSPNHLIETSLPALDDVPMAAVLAPPSPCNRNGALGRLLAGAPHVAVTRVDGAGHGDIEGAGQAVYRRACGDRSDSGVADEVLASVLSHVMEFACDQGRAARGRSST